MIRCAFTVLLLTALAVPVLAQTPQASGLISPGARAGNSYVPSTHTPGCGGIMCDSDDPRRVANVPPPPCEGLICGISPYAMRPPVTASEAARLQAERARAEAAAAAVPTPEPATRQKRRRAKAKTHKPKTVASRTPDPAATPAPAPSTPQ